jgi:hypothetical protein
MRRRSQMARKKQRKTESQKLPKELDDPAYRAFLVKYFFQADPEMETLTDKLAALFTEEEERHE